MKVTIIFERFVVLMWKHLNFQFPPNLFWWLEVFTRIFFYCICNFKTNSCQSWPWLGLSKNWPHIHYWEKSCKRFKSSKQIRRELKIQMFPHQNFEPFKDNCNLHSLRDLYHPNDTLANVFLFEKLSLISIKLLIFIYLHLSRWYQIILCKGTDLDLLWY